VPFALVSVVVPVAGGAADPKSGPAHITTTHRFLMAWSHEQWDELRAVSADSVAIKIGDKTFALNPVARKSDVALLAPFRGLSTVRSGTDGTLDVGATTVGALRRRTNEPGSGRADAVGAITSTAARAEATLAAACRYWIANTRGAPGLASSARIAGSPGRVPVA